MKKYLFIIISVFLFSSAYSQNLTVKGKVYDKKNDTLYYTTYGKPFNKKSFVLIDKENNYSLTMKHSKWSKIETLVFSQNIKYSSTDENACTQKLNIQKALQTGILSKKPTIITDISLDDNCAVGMYWGAREEGKGKFIGTYYVSNLGIINRVSLADFYFKARLYYSSLTDELISEEAGTWYYDEDKKQIIVRVNSQINPDLGIIIKNKKEYVFDVIEENGVIILLKSNNP